MPTNNEITQECLQLLKIILDTNGSLESLSKRLSIVNEKLAIKDKAEALKERPLIIKETAFLIKNKKDVVAEIGEVKYLEMFSALIKFLENNPEPKIEKKKKKKGKKGTKTARPIFLDPVRNEWRIEPIQTLGRFDPVEIAPDFGNELDSLIRTLQVESTTPAIDSLFDSDEDEG